MGRLKAMPPRLALMAPRLRPAPKLADRFYLSPEWKAARERQGDKWCAVCGSTRRLVLDHKRERKDGGADLDPANLQWLCHGCHQRKTAQARARRASGRA